MTMTLAREYAIEYLTFLGRSPESFIRLAASAGFNSIGLRLHSADQGEGVPDLRVGTARHKALADTLRENAMGVLDIEVFPVTETTDVRSWKPHLEAGAAFGARYVNVVADDPDHVRLTETLAELAEICRPLNLMPALEPMAWKSVSRLEQASEIAQIAGIQIQIDTLHLHRSGDSAEVVRAIDPALWAYVQWSDAPATPPSTIPLELRDEGRYSRLSPGEGELPLAELQSALPDHLIWAAEVPSTHQRARVGDLEHARALRLALERMER